MSIVKLDEFTFYHLIDHSEGIVLVFFSSLDCGSCHHLRQVLEAYQGIWGNISIYEVDAQVSAGLTQAFDVFHLPSMFLFKDGQYHAQLQSEPLPKALHDAIAQALCQPAQEQP